MTWTKLKKLFNLKFIWQQTNHFKLKNLQSNLSFHLNVNSWYLKNFNVFKIGKFQIREDLKTKKKTKLKITGNKSHWHYLKRIQIIFLSFFNQNLYDMLIQHVHSVSYQYLSILINTMVYKFKIMFLTLFNMKKSYFIKKKLFYLKKKLFY